MSCRDVLVLSVEPRRVRITEEDEVAVGQQVDETDAEAMERV
jgi:hypothetical protein